jgi:peptidylprolyl isomerase
MNKMLLLVFLVVSSYAGNITAILKTTSGDIEIKLRPDIAPNAVKNFVGHINSGYYNGVIFHRVIKNFMIQSGDPTGTGRGGESIWKKDFKDEFKKNVVFDKSGILAMANRGSNTNGSQFFITTVPTSWLNGKHTIFGYVARKSMKIVRKIENVKVSNSRPVKIQKIIKAYIKR